MSFFTLIKDALLGIVGTTVCSLPVALAFAYTLRVPIPLGAYIGPLGEMGPYSIAFVDVLQMVFLAWLFYGITGGFILLAVLGAVTGVTTGKRYAQSAHRSRIVMLWAAAASVLPVLLISTLDYVIGPW